MSQFRSMWKGHIRFGLVTVPVKAFSATESEGEVRLRQLHKDCHRPINYRKVCPIHGEIKNEEIVSGYEHAKDQFVIIDSAELDKLHPEGEKGINIEAFVPAGEVDPLYFSGKTHYLLPEGPVGTRPYLLLQRAMAEEEQVGVAKLFWFGRENMVLVRPLERLIAISTLNYASGVRKPEAFQGDLPEAELPEEELKMARMLIEASGLPTLDLSQYKDRYREEVQKLVEAKVAGKELVMPPASEAPKVIDIMEALKRSVAEAQKKRPEAKPAERKMAASGRRQASQAKKKSG